jgi:ribosomal protein S20
MAITKGAKKAIRVSARKRVYNIRRKVALHDTVKSLKTTIATGNQKDLVTHMSLAYQAIDKAASVDLSRRTLQHVRSHD